MNRRTASHFAALPPDRFYWALLDAPAGQSQLSRKQLGYLFEAYLPCTIEEVQAAYKPLPNKRYLACGMTKDVLSAETGQDQVALSPSEIPAFLKDEGIDVDPSELNLLTGDFEPKPIRKLRRRWLTQFTLLALLCGLLVSLGIYWRASSISSQADQLRAHQREVFRQVLGADALSRAQPPELQLRAELRQLRQTRSSEAPETHRADLSHVLASLLSHWPNVDQTEPLYIQADHLSVTPNAITVRGQLPDTDQAQHLASLLRPLDGWELQQPQLNSTRDGVQATLRFSPASSEENHQ